MNIQLTKTLKAAVGVRRMLNEGAEMFTFSGNAVEVEVAGASSNFAQAAGETFAQNVTGISSASEGVANNLPNIAEQGLSIA